MSKRLLRLLSALLAFTLLAAACSDDDEPVTAGDDAADDSSSDDEMSDDEMADDEMSDDEMSDDEMSDDEMSDDEMSDDGSDLGTIVDVAVANEFTTLVAAVEAAGLVETLSGEGPFTVFAPTDDAFAAALESLGLTAEELLASEDLADILTYHVIAGEVDAETAIGLDGQSAATVNGAEINISVVDGSVVINDTATVVTADVPASNGIVHVIDAVLLPPDA